MRYKTWFSILLLAATVLFLGARITNACSCGPKRTVLAAYEAANDVVIAKVVSVEKTEKAAPEGQISDGENFVDGVKSTRMLVERVFKGSLKVGEELTFGQGGGADCIWTFAEQNIGQQFLFYLGSREKNPKLWYAVTCGRSNGLSYANDDLLYLNRLDKVRGKTRISGTLDFDGGDHLSVEGRKIRITGANKTYEVKTDRNGVYEIYDLPAGKYIVEPEVPAGWKVNQFYLGYSSSVAGDGDDASPKKIPIILESNKHAGLDLTFEIDNVIRGTVYDSNGKPMKGVCIDAVFSDIEKKSGYHADCTEEDGSFALTEVQPGSYILVINGDGKISSEEPFGTFYYPDVFEREKATVLTIGPGDTLEGFNIHVPRTEEVITIEGVLLYSDGKPVVDESVEFKAEKTGGNVEGDARAQTNAQGRFSVKILKGLKGELYGEMYTYVGEFENCPKLEEIIRKVSKGTFAEVVTPAVSVHADKDVRGVELKYPFPGCKKAKVDKEE